MTLPADEMDKKPIHCCSGKCEGEHHTNLTPSSPGEGVTFNAKEVAEKIARHYGPCMNPGNVVHLAELIEEALLVAHAAAEREAWNAGIEKAAKFMEEYGCTGCDHFGHDESPQLIRALKLPGGEV